ncbi:MAG: T9SS type A sorting domain-containing protein [Lentimicrobiaceae bacterium]
MPDYIIPIGFDFFFFNSTIDTLFFFETAPSILSSSKELNGFHKIIIPFGASLVDRGIGSSHSLSPLSYQLSGEIGSRILKIEWKNAGFAIEYYLNNTLDDYVNFQLWLYETSGKMEIHYGPSQISHPEFAYADETGPSVTLVPKFDYVMDTMSKTSLWLQGSPFKPSMVESDNSFYLDGTITPNSVYHFNNLIVSSAIINQDAPIVYPNPVKDRLNIRLQNYPTLPITVLFCNMSGRIMNEVYISSNHIGEMQIPVSFLTSGIYQLIIINGKETYTTRLLKY